MGTLSFFFFWFIENEKKKTKIPMPGIEPEASM